MEKKKGEEERRKKSKLQIKREREGRFSFFLLLPLSSSLTVLLFVDRNRFRRDFSLSRFSFENPFVKKNRLIFAPEFLPTRSNFLFPFRNSLGKKGGGGEACSRRGGRKISRQITA